MLYLEDYLEMIEHLPEELRDRFTSMREMDLQVQNALESLEKRVKTFFSNASTMKPQDREAEYAEIKKDYQKALEDADEKVHLANHMHDLLSLYVRRLEQECHKFKMELEADHAGITEILEKRSEEMDVSSSSYSQKENRYSAVINRPSVSTVAEKKRDPSVPEYKRLLAIEKMIPDIRPTVTPPQVTPPAPAPATPPVNYYLGHMGAGGTAIVAAATQAIAATQQMQQGRRTASLKASYEAINSVTGGMSAIQSHELGISKELAGAAQTAIAAIQDTSKKNKKKSTKSSGSSSQSVTPVNLQTPVESPTDSSSSNRNDSSYDPNEPRYCICNEVAYGGMVACDNKNCPHEWFHYPCVGITDPPKGSWYCPQCLAAKKNRGSRKKKGPFGIEETVQNVMRNIP